MLACSFDIFDFSLWKPLRWLTLSPLADEEPLTTRSSTTPTAPPSSTGSSSTTSMTPTSEAPSPTEAEQTPPRPFEGCLPRMLRNVSWPATPPGQLAVAPCPNRPDLKAAVWQCSLSDGDWLGRPDLSRCVSPRLGALQEKVSTLYSDLRDS